MRWFRFYSEFVDDPKIAMMSDSDQLLWVKALCLASENSERGFITLTDEEICWKLRVTLETWRHAIDKFRAKGMIEHCSGGYKIINWDKRQFESDSSAKRVAKHRSKSRTKKAIQATKRACNVTVTPPDTDTYTDPEDLVTSKNNDRDRTDKNDRLRDRDCSARKKKGKGESANEIYASLANLEVFENFWKWIAGEYAKVSDPKTGRKPALGSKAEAAKAWRDYIESGDRVEDLRQAAQLASKVNAFQQIGLPHICRWLKDGHWENILTQYEATNGESAAIAGEFAGGDSGLSQEELTQALGKELSRLGLNGLLTPEWQEKTGCVLISELDQSKTQAYLKYLRGLQYAVN